ncbi:MULTISPECIES: hypothetical protein [unclassified Pseudoalteromonas]|uniref:hypothetical protein n=1 Tax=unclassified Pseudoalteromonas TaxID=194690 RepID=UPI002097FE6E|nr:hypothetical protein [Pseudoalteromonas sp. XMcav2-N]MCO7188583.1 hypothetical protein [Pseudoalteromonas sp. XMcav2-N]
MEPKKEEQKVALVISKATVLCILYFAVYFSCERVTVYFYNSLNHYVFFMMCLFKLTLLYNIIVEPLFFREKNKIYSLALYLYGGGGCAFLYGYDLRGNFDVSTEMGAFFYYSTYLALTFIIEIKEEKLT